MRCWLRVGRDAPLGMVVNPGQAAEGEAAAGTGDGDVGEASLAVVDRAGNRGPFASCRSVSLGGRKSSAILTVPHSRPLARWAVETVMSACASE